MLLGFSEENRDKYVEQYLGDDVTEFRQLLRKFPDLKGLSTKPTLLEMLCFLIQQTPRGQLAASEELTLTDIYQKVLIALEMRSIWFHKESPTNHQKKSKEKALPTHRQFQIDFAAECAAEAWKKGDQRLLPELVQTVHQKQEKLSKRPLRDILLNLGVLRAVTSERQIESRTWEFPHRSIHEFFVALDFIRRTRDKKKQYALVDYLSSSFPQEPTSLVMPFTVGLLTREPYRDEILAQQLCKSVRVPYLYLGISAFEYPQRLLIDALWFRCLNEIPHSILRQWPRESLIPSRCFDWFNIRFKATLLSTHPLGHQRFWDWPIVKESKFEGSTEGSLAEFAQFATKYLDLAVSRVMFRQILPVHRFHPFPGEILPILIEQNRFSLIRLWVNSKQFLLLNTYGKDSQTLLHHAVSQSIGYKQITLQILLDLGIRLRQWETGLMLSLLAFMFSALFESYPANIDSQKILIGITTWMLACFGLAYPPLRASVLSLTAITTIEDCFLLVNLIGFTFGVIFLMIGGIRYSRSILFSLASIFSIDTYFQMGIMRSDLFLHLGISFLTGLVFTKMLPPGPNIMGPISTSNTGFDLPAVLSGGSIVVSMINPHVAKTISLFSAIVGTASVAVGATPSVLNTLSSMVSSIVLITTFMVQTFGIPYFAMGAGTILMISITYYKFMLPKKRLDLIRWLIDQSPELLFTKNKLGQTPLDLSHEKGNHAYANLLKEMAAFHKRNRPEQIDGARPL